MTIIANRIHKEDILTARDVVADKFLFRRDNGQWVIIFEIGSFSPEELTLTPSYAVDTARARVQGLSMTATTHVKFAEIVNRGKAVYLRVMIDADDWVTNHKLIVRRHWKSKYKMEDHENDHS